MINIRKATTKDSKQILDLSNEYNVRMASFNSYIISSDEHEKWFSEKLKDKNCLFLIGELNNEFAAQIRFDKKETLVIISISVIPDLRNKGIGKLLFLESLKELKKTFPNVEKIVAKIKSNNKQSIFYFESLGFVLDKEYLLNDIKIVEYIYKTKQEIQIEGK